jgi:hypothetical protein
METDCQNLVVVSDQHFGCRLGLCHPTGVALDDGGYYTPSAVQLKIWDYWHEFWTEFVPSVVHDEPYDIVNNGDALNGKPHRAETNISDNRHDQFKLAEKVLLPIVDECEKRGGRYYHIRGTEAHVGKSGQEEERLADALGAVPNIQNQHARWELWKLVGNGLVHLLHHVGTTGSRAYEATAIHKELVETFAESAQWSQRAPDIIVRSHRHRWIETAMPVSHEGIEVARSMVTPGWQAKTPFVYKIPGGRLSRPQFGGLVIRQHKEGVLFVRRYVKTIAPPPPE